MRNLKILLTTITSLIVMGSFAQNGTISGTVSDKFGLLPGAKVEIIGTDKRTNCDINGAYSFMVEPGTYVVKASYLMYQSREMEVKISFGNLNPDVSFTLIPGSYADEQAEIGTRFSPKNQLESPVSIDIITNEEIRMSPHLSLTQFLMSTVPSFNSNRQTIADGTDHISPATMRGLGSDQFLVLINGKRRHSSSLLNVNGTVGRGSVTTDLDAIPISAVDRIEIMRDGAGAQYGSDAMAGVINIILKDKTKTFSMRTAYQPTIAGDGAEQFLGVSYGVGSGERGYINIAAEIRRRQSVNRSGDYTGNVYSDNDSIDALLIAENDFFGTSGLKGNRVMEIGGAQTFDGTLHLNAALQMTKNSEFYANGGFNYRQGESRAFYRFPKDERQVVRELHPHGFLPEIHTDIFDRSGTFGVRGTRRGWFIDLSNTFGQNRLDYTVRNSNNASMGIASPTDFYAGGFSYGQNTTNLDFSRQAEKTKFLYKIDMAFGAEFRIENYSIRAGDDASWKDGGDTLGNGESRLAGSQGFVGFQPQNELSTRRAGGAVYGDVDWHILKNWLFETAVRYEEFSDFGSNVNWKLATRVKMAEQWSVRASYSTNYRAPSLHQIHFNSLSTQFVDGEAYQVGTFNNESAVAQAFGIERLKPETSTNYSLGLTAKPFKNFTMSLDGFYIGIKNRILLSGRFDDGYEEILNPVGAGAAQFFTNSVNTETYGFDAESSYNLVMKKGYFRFTAGYNYSKTRVMDTLMVSDLLVGGSQTLLNREEVSRIESAQPSSKFIFNVTYNTKRWEIGLRNSYFGKVKYVHPEDGDPSNWVLNENTGVVESRDQVFKGKWITDANIGFHLNKYVTFSVGGNNIFNIYPDKHTHSANINEGRFVYSRRVQQFGVRGAMYYIRLRLNL